MLSCNQKALTFKSKYLNHSSISNHHMNKRYYQTNSGKAPFFTDVGRLVRLLAQASTVGPLKTIPYF